MKTIKLIVLIGLMSKTIAAEDVGLGPTFGLEQAYFCAICEAVDAGAYAKPLADKYPTLDFFRLRPVKIYWGSFNGAKSSLLVHPFSKGEGREVQMLVVIRSENNLGPGDWIKSYTPIQKNARPPSYYLLDGKGTVSGDELKRFLEQYSKVMQKKFPLDKDSPAKEGASSKTPSASTGSNPTSAPPTAGGL